MLPDADLVTEGLGVVLLVKVILQRPQPVDRRDWLDTRKAMYFCRLLANLVISLSRAARLRARACLSISLMSRFGASTQSSS